jgi:hypothetical protein
MTSLIKKYKSLLLPILLVLFLLTGGFVHQVRADTTDCWSTKNQMTCLDQVKNDLDLSNKSFPEIIGGIIKIVLSFLGIVFFVLILYSGILWMTSGGNQTKIETAKQTISSATIGWIIVMSSYSLSVYIMSKLSEVGIIS